MNSSDSTERDSSPKVKRLNPWTGIWWNTRETLIYVWQHLLEEYTHRIYIMLGLAFMLAMRLPDWYSIPPHPIGVMVQLLLFAPIGGILAGYLFSAVLRMVGRWAGKSVPSLHTKAMVAWSDLPFILMWAVFVGMFLLLDRSQGPLHKGHIWLLQGFMGWLPVLVAAPFYVFAVAVRLRSITVLLGVPSWKALLIWFTSVVITFVPAAFFLYVYFILYYVTSTGG